MIKSSPNKYIDKVGPKDNPEKYGLIQEIGKGVFWRTYKARNLSRQTEEDEFYLVKNHVTLNHKESSFGLE